jgi:hypothetical protein
MNQAALAGARLSSSMLAACRAFSRRPDKCKSVRSPVPLSSTRAFPRCSEPWSTCLSSFSPRVSLRPRGSSVDGAARDHGVVTRWSCRAHRDRRDAGSRGRLALRTRARRPLCACTQLGGSESCGSAESQCSSLGAAEQVGRARANEGGADVVIHGFLSRRPRRCHRAASVAKWGPEVPRRLNRRDRRERLKRRRRSSPGETRDGEPLGQWSSS